MTVAYNTLDTMISPEESFEQNTQNSLLGRLQTAKDKAAPHIWKAIMAGAGMYMAHELNETYQWAQTALGTGALMAAGAAVNYTVRSAAMKFAQGPVHDGANKVKEVAQDLDERIGRPLYIATEFAEKMFGAAAMTGLSGAASPLFLGASAVSAAGKTLQTMYSPDNRFDMEPQYSEKAWKLGAAMDLAGSVGLMANGAIGSASGVPSTWEQAGTMYTPVLALGGAGFMYETGRKILKRPLEDRAEEFEGALQPALATQDNARAGQYRSASLSRYALPLITGAVAITLLAACGGNDQPAVQATATREPHPTATSEAVVPVASATAQQVIEPSATAVAQPSSVPSATLDPNYHLEDAAVIAPDFDGDCVGQVQPHADGLQLFADIRGLNGSTIPHDIAARVWNYEGNGVDVVYPSADRDMTFVYDPGSQLHIALNMPFEDLQQGLNIPAEMYHVPLLQPTDDFIMGVALFDAQGQINYDVYQQCHITVNEGAVISPTVTPVPYASPVPGATITPGTTPYVTLTPNPYHTATATQVIPATSTLPPTATPTQVIPATSTLPPTATQVIPPTSTLPPTATATQVIPATSTPVPTATATQVIPATSTLPPPPTVTPDPAG